MSQNNLSGLTRRIAEQLGVLFIQNLEQAEMIAKLQEEITRLENEKKAVQDTSKPEQLKDSI